MEFEIFKKRLYTGDILDYSIEFFRNNYKKLFILTLVFHVPIIIIIGFITGNGGMISKSLAVTISNPNINFPIMEIVSLYIGILLNLVYSSYILPILTLAVIKFTFDGAISNKYYKTNALLGYSIKKLGWYILSSLIIGAITGTVISVLYFILIVAVILSTYLFTYNIVLGIISIIITSLLCIAFIIVLIYFSTRIIFMPHAIILENANSITALSSSFKLTKKKFWRSAFVYFWAGILVMFIPTLLSSLQVFLPFNDFVVNRVIYAILMGGVALFYPFMQIATTMLYTNYRAENGSLQLIKDVEELVKDEDDSIAYVNNYNVGQNYPTGVKYE